MKNIIVSDMTLTALEKQDQGLRFREKLAIADKLDLALVDIIELPKLNDSKESEVVCRTIASSIKNAKVKISVGDDVESVALAVECVKNAKKFALQVAMPISTARMEYEYHLKAPAMLNRIVELVKKALEYSSEVEFVALDAFRAEEGFLDTCVCAAVEAGATEVTLSDDAGDAFPEEFASVVKQLKNKISAKIYVQPSDKLSMATSIAVESVKVGADGVKTSVFGDYLKMSVFADVIRAKKYVLDVDSNVDVTKVKSIFTAISKVEDTNQQEENGVVGGNISGNATLTDIAEIVKNLGYELSDSDLGKVYEEFKKLTSKKDVIDTKEFEAVIASTAMQVPSTYHLVNYVVNSGNIIPATANVTLEKDGEKYTGVSTGDGPIDAAFHAIEQIIGHHYELDDFQVHAVTKGRGAVGSSIIRLRADGKLFPGNGVSTDIVGACIRAYINALNKIVYEEE